jgi:hypothetical protein
MKDYSIGFTAPSTTFPGATISPISAVQIGNSQAQTQTFVKGHSRFPSPRRYFGKEQLETDLGREGVTR